MTCSTRGSGSVGLSWPCRRAGRRRDHGVVTAVWVRYFVPYGNSESARWSHGCLMQCRNRASVSCPPGSRFPSPLQGASRSRPRSTSRSRRRTAACSPSCMAVVCSRWFVAACLFPCSTNWWAQSADRNGNLAAVIGIPATTLARRKRSGMLTPSESDRLVRIARLEAMAVAMMRGDAGAAGQWLRTPHDLLDRETPLERASTETGARDVELLIGRLRHGVFG